MKGGTLGMQIRLTCTYEMQVCRHCSSCKYRAMFNACSDRMFQVYMFI